MVKLKMIGKKGKIIVAGLAIAAISLGFYAVTDKDFEIAKQLDIFVSMYREIDLFYVDEKSPEELISAGIKGMLETLDPYTTYIPEKDVEDLRFMTTGQYGGIGALIRKAGEYTIISEPYEGFPAQSAGLLAGDTLISIDGISTRGKPISEVSDLLKGTPETKVKIQIKRPGQDEPQLKSFTREKITIRNVPYYGFVDSRTGYIRLGNFTQEASKEVRNAVKSLKEQGAKSLVLDLRGNPGGLLNEAVEIANIWVEKGEEIVSTRGKARQWDHSYKTEDHPMDTSMRVAILVNRGSASASEIVAGALQDLDRAVIVGERTFGKGLVQTTRQLSYNTHLKITTAKYYIPSGRCIQALDYAHRNEDGSVGYIPDSLISAFTTRNGRTVYDGGGIRPDIEVEMPTPANITFSLYVNNLIFDFATLYRAGRDSISGPESFRVDDNLYDEFIAFLSDKDFEYNTRSNEELDKLIRIAKNEGYYKIAEEEIKALRLKLGADTEKDLLTFREEISELLREEIVSRYYFQKGRIIAGLQDDPQLAEALRVLDDPERFISILQPDEEQQQMVQRN